MTDRTPAHLADMLQFVQELQSFVNGVPVDAFVQNRVLCLATEKLFINLGEAASRMGLQATAMIPNVPWRQIVGLRNVLAHGYEAVAHEVLYRTAQDDLPGVERALQKALEAYRLP